MKMPPRKLLIVENTIRASRPGTATTRATVPRRSVRRGAAPAGPGPPPGGENGGEVDHQAHRVQAERRDTGTEHDGPLAVVVDEAAEAHTAERGQAQEDPGD